MRGNLVIPELLATINIEEGGSKNVQVKIIRRKEQVSKKYYEVNNLLGNLKSSETIRQTP